MITVTGLKRSFSTAAGEIQVLKGIDFHAGDGEFVAIMGRSGAGKSTFLYQISLLDEPNEGVIEIDGRNALAMEPEEKTRYRLDTFGFVFQDYALLPELTALENVALPLLMQGLTKHVAYQKALEALARVRLDHRPNNLPSQLSGGEQQRVSIARAVAHGPSILFADEPTANLDNESSLAVLAIFEELHEAGQTIIMVTHEEEFAAAAKRLVKIDDGRVTYDGPMTLRRA